MGVTGSNKGHRESGLETPHTRTSRRPASSFVVYFFSSEKGKLCFTNLWFLFILVSKHKRKAAASEAWLLNDQNVEIDNWIFLTIRLKIPRSSITSRQFLIGAKYTSRYFDPAQ